MVKTDLQEDVSCTKPISVQPYACSTNEEFSKETNLCRPAVDGQTIKNLWQLACEFEFDQSDHKYLQFTGIKLK